MIPAGLGTLRALFRLMQISLLTMAATFAVAYIRLSVARLAPARVAARVRKVRR